MWIPLNRGYTRAEAHALIAFGYEQMLIDAFDDERHKAAARVVIADLKKEKILVETLRRRDGD